MGVVLYQMDYSPYAIPTRQAVTALDEALANVRKKGQCAMRDTLGLSPVGLRGATENPEGTDTVNERLSAGNTRPSQ